MTDLKVTYIPISELKPATYNPRKWDEEAVIQLTESIKRFGLVDPIVVNGAKERFNIVIGGHFRLKVAKDLGFKEIPAVYINIPDEQREKELNLRLNRNVGDWDWELLSEFNEEMLTDIGFSSEELDDIFDIEDDNPEQFDLQKELEKLDIKNIEIQKGDIWQLGDNRLMCGDSTIEKDVLTLMN
ncbi:MAG TPA: ParB N-terminal domain-containing protein [Candidatus Woesebacteria bacterium]|nr:ParB N-terminal domain-containing protein [Candidatus Woesebacteria bacterium]